MRTTLLSTVTVAALAASFGAVQAQNTEKGGASSGRAMEQNAPAGGAGTIGRGAAGERDSGAAERSQPNAGSPMQAQTPSDSKTDMKAQTPAAGSNGEKAGTDSSAQRTGDVKQTSPDSKPGTVGAAPSGEARLTAEQRTQIREKVIPTGPKVSSVNFSLNVGTIVPRTVQVAEVPPVIIDMHPEWRGYRYFIANDQIVIVERDSLKIVAVLDV